MKKILSMLLITLTLLSCSTEETETTKEARVNIVSAFNLPTSVSHNNIPLPIEYHNGQVFKVKTGDVIKASGRQIWISINGEEVLNTQGYGEYIVE